jgi:hypothetical protein
MDWWDNITKSVGGMFAPAEPEEKKPALDMGLWGPVLEKAGYTKESPEYMLLDTIGKHYDRTPMPKEPSMGQKLLSGALMAGSAGLARLGGANHNEAMRGVFSMSDYLRERQATREAAAMALHGDAGKTAMGQASSAVSTAQARRLAKEMAERQYGRIFGTPPSPEEPAAPPTSSVPPIHSPGTPPTGAIPPPGAGSGGAVPPPAGGSVAPGGSPQPGKTAAGGPPGAKSGAAFGEPQYPLAPNSPIRFYTRQYRDAAIPVIEAAIAENAAAISSGKSKDDVLKAEAQKPGSALQELLKADHAAWQSSPEYKAHEEYRGANSKRSFETVKEYDAAAAAARKSNADLAQFEQALFAHLGEGGKTGPLEDWATTLKSWANGIPGVDFDISRAEEMRKASVGAATKMMRAATVGPTSDREMKTFLETVTSMGLSTQGNLRLLPFLKLQNDAQLEVRSLAGRLMEENNGQLPWDFADRAAEIQIKYQQEAKRLGNELVADYKAGKFGPAKGAADAKTPAKPGDAPAPMSQADATAAAKEILAKNPGMTPADAMKQALAENQKKAAAPGATPAGQPAPATPAAAPPPGAAPAAGNKPPTQAAPIGTRKDGWIMSPSGWVTEEEAGKVNSWMWRKIGGAGQQQPAGPPAPRQPINPKGASWWSRGAEENIRRSTGMGG